MRQLSLTTIATLALVIAVFASTAVGAQTFLERIDEEEESIVAFESEIQNRFCEW